MSEIQNKEDVWLEKVLNYFVAEKVIIKWKKLPDENKKRKVEICPNDEIAKFFSKKVGSMTVAVEFIVFSAETNAALAEQCWQAFYNHLQITKYRPIDKLLSPIKHFFAGKTLEKWSKWKKENAPK